MFNYYLRRTAYKDYDKETQDKLLQLYKWAYMMLWICTVIILAIITLPIMEVLYSIYVDKEMLHQVIFVIGGLVYYLAVIIMIKPIFENDDNDMEENIISKLRGIIFTVLYFDLCTKKGKAISKADFKVIEKSNINLYVAMLHQACIGRCYHTSYYLCQTLKKGSIEFLATKKLMKHDEMEEATEKYNMHVIFVNNGWCFDTNTMLQFPIEKMYEIYEPKVYGSFDYEKISGVPITVFADKLRPELTKFAKENNSFGFSGA